MPPIITFFFFLATALALLCVLIIIINIIRQKRKEKQAEKAVVTVASVRVESKQSGPNTNYYISMNDEVVRIVTNYDEALDIYNDVKANPTKYWRKGVIND